MSRQFTLVLLLFIFGQTLCYENFLDCPGNTGWFGYTQSCCSSNQLPNDCECFDIGRWTSVFTNSYYNKPECPEDVRVRFKLYQRGRNSGVQIRAGKKIVAASSYDQSLPTRFISHGYGDTANNPWPLDMKDELLKYEKCNVILVDWEKGAASWNYYQAVANSRTVGAMIARLIQDLHTHKQAPFSSFHLIGHSLGAHVMGYAGKEIQRLEGSNIGRISGLDPPGLGFENWGPVVRLDKSDAEFVDVIHTDAETILSLGFGTRLPMGHVDFYPNGGKNQAGCVKKTYWMLFSSDRADMICSHMRVNDYFTYSINTCRYNPPTGGDECTMGFHTKSTCRGEIEDLVIKTDSAPFC